jgi:hypothetical protein
MPQQIRHLLSTLGLLVGVAVQAQTPPPVKPGLWQVDMTREGEGVPAMPDMSERLKNMPPERRAQMEAMMKSRGVDLSGGLGHMKVCLDKDSIDRGRWQGENDPGRCKTEMKSRTATRWSWHSECTEPASVSDGEAAFVNDQTYTVDTTSTVTRDGKSRTIKMHVASKWLGADCGDIKPVQPMKAMPLPKAR